MNLFKLPFPFPKIIIFVVLRFFSFISQTTYAFAHPPHVLYSH